MVKILTTHTGSLPRPPKLIEALRKREKGEKPKDFDAIVSKAVSDVVKKQIEVGLDVISDGEQSKAGYSFYVKHRLTGFEGKGNVPPFPLEMLDYPVALKALQENPALKFFPEETCRGEIEYIGDDLLETDINNFKAALEKENFDIKNAFMTAASPGVIALFFNNNYYPSHRDYLAALAKAMRKEYEKIVKEGFILQLDCPELGMGWHMKYIKEGREAFNNASNLHVEAVNSAIEGLPQERLRLHACWGNYIGCHTLDLTLPDILPTLYKANVRYLSFVGANGRHEWEWKAFKEHPLPEDKIIIPGVIDQTTPTIEHPKTVEDRGLRYANVVGPNRLQLGTDCGFGTFADFRLVEEKIAWEKLKSLVEGAKFLNASLQK